MAQNKTLELSIKIAGKVDKSLTTAINQTNTLMGSLTTTMNKVGTAGLAAMDLPSAPPRPRSWKTICLRWCATWTG